mgnify:CR=1 FL=1
MIRRPPRSTLVARRQRQMCIRDSLLHVEDLPEKVRRLILEKAEGNPFFVEEVIRSLPVSYTHLRAHETVLDIVCRLLLEKKNQEGA